MRAIQVLATDGPEALELGQAPTPVLGDGQLLIEVHSAGVSYPDLLLSQGRYQISPPLPFVPGSEVAGVVADAAPGAGFHVGDRVCAFTFLGGFAELAVVAADNTHLLPDHVSFDVGASLPMNYLTVQFALGRRGRLAAGESVLVHGAAGGVGTAAIQYARWRGATTIAVVSSEAKAAVAREAGADEVVTADGFLDQVRELTRGRGVDVVVDPVGGERFTDSLRSLAPEGRLLVIGFTAGEIPSVKVNRLLLNNLDVVGVAWGALAFGRPGFLAEQWAELAPGIASEALAPPVGQRFPLAEAGAALASLAERQALGKVVLDMDR